MDIIEGNEEAMNVMITGTGRKSGLGYNLVLRYLESGNQVIATVRKPSEDLETLQKEYEGRLTILTMDIGNMSSVEEARSALKVDHIDLLINNATIAADYEKGFFDVNFDNIPKTVNVAAVGAMRVIKAFYDLLLKSEMTAMIINVSSEAGSISRCYRTTGIDYGMAKAALNMATMNIVNTFKEQGVFTKRGVNIFCIHPGWIRTDGREDNPAPLSSYEAAGILMELFEKRREDFEGHRFITNEGEDYPF